MATKTGKRSHHKPRIGRPPKHKKPGRPLKVVPEHEIVRLAATGSTAESIAVRLGITRDLLYRRFKHLLDRGRVLRDSDLQRRQYEVAMSGCASLLIWLGKQWLGQTDKIVQTGPDPLAELVVAMTKESKRIGPPESPMLPEHTEEEAPVVAG
jgi:Helix-turn-helix domain of resolvase